MRRKLGRRYTDIMVTLYRLRAYLFRHLGGLVLGLILVIAANSSALLGPLVLGRAIDNLRHTGVGTSLLVSAALIAGVAVVQGLFGFFARYTLLGVSREIEYELRNDVFAHFQRLELAYFQRHKVGDLVARAINDLTAVRALLGPGLNSEISTRV